MSFVANALGDVGHAIGGAVKGVTHALGPVGTAAALAAAAYFGAPYLLGSSATAAPSAMSAAAPSLFTEGGITSGSAAMDASLGLGSAAAGAGGLALGAGGGFASPAAFTAASPWLTAPTAGVGAGAGIVPTLGATTPTSGLLSMLGGEVGKLPLSSWLSIGGGLYGLQQSQYLQKLAEQQAAQQQGVSAQQQGYAAQLAALQANPSMVTSLPGYEAGLQAVERSQAAGGYLGSGNMMAALQQYGGQAYQQQWQNLAALSGLTTPNNYAAQTGGAAAGLTSSALASIGYGATLPQLTALLTKAAG